MSLFVIPNRSGIGWRFAGGSVVLVVRGEKRTSQGEMIANGVPCGGFNIQPTWMLDPKLRAEKEAEAIKGKLLRRKRA